MVLFTDNGRSVGPFFKHMYPKCVGQFGQISQKHVEVFAICGTFGNIFLMLSIAFRSYLSKQVFSDHPFRPNKHKALQN